MPLPPGPHLVPSPNGGTFLLVDKPAGPTSHDIVDQVRRLAGTRRVGHAGTLDPFATGLLILGIDKATKDLAGLLGADKSYVAEAQLGATSETDDPEGPISERLDAVPLAEVDIRAALARFLGEHDQVAPAYSAKKIGGKKLYDLARAGKADTVERPIKRIRILEIELLTYAWPRVRFSVTCSSGTYIRAIARDLGAALGTGAYLTALRRTRIGSLRVEDALALDVPAKKRLPSA